MPFDALWRATPREVRQMLELRDGQFLTDSEHSKLHEKVTKISFLEIFIFLDSDPTVQVPEEA